MTRSQIMKYANQVASGRVLEFRCSRREAMAYGLKLAHQFAREGYVFGFQVDPAGKARTWY